ncbi:Flp pilus assembly protein CpaB [Bacterioplanes sanyensis]|uniref:Flp pilus assembly protein CpaB n=1 Tax=Bacterioplanes sanyensis TaxID=1249553 RepID=A0A222FKT6_9GAMM|nr:Flp pilus assembly protein CpaB [Bacterioplanes sanyensis]ASP38833.1 Flp pilus assembly protein CpaB [Bacterioplanes sanyensis]
MTMKRSWLIYAGLASSLAGLALTLNSPDSSAKADHTPQVLTLNHDLQAGTLMHQRHVYWRSVSAEEWQQLRLSGAIISAEKEQERQHWLDKIQGSAVRLPLKAEQNVYQNQLVRAGESGFLALTVAPGKRAISVRLKPSAISEGLISPGDFVDLIVTTQAQQWRRSVDSNPSKRDFRTWRSSVVASDIRVLAINQVASADSYQSEQLTEGKRPRHVTVTFETTPEQAVRIPLAEQMSGSTGLLSVSLRHPQDRSYALSASKASDLFPETKQDGLEQNTYLIRGEEREVSGGL